MEYGCDATKTSISNKRFTVKQGMKKDTSTLWIAALAFGTASQIAQALLLREFMSVFQGNELSIGIVLGSWLAWVGIGSRLGALRVCARWSAATRLLAGAATTVVLLPGTVTLIRISRVFFDAAPGMHPSLPALSGAAGLLPAPLCLLFGAQFVWLAEIWRERHQNEASAGKAYAGEAAGNMLGGLAFTFALVHLLNPLASAVLASVPLLAALALIRRRPARGAWVLGLLAVALIPFLGHLDRLASRLHWQRFLPDYRLLDTTPSRHGVITIAQNQDQISVFQSGTLVFASAGPATPQPGFEQQDASALAHLAMTQHQQPQRVLLIGGGLSGTLAAMLKHPVAHIDYVELDPALAVAVTPYLPPAMLTALADPRVTIRHGDGRLFMKTAQDRYDLIVVDVPDPVTTALNRFYTREFFSEAHARLSPEGALVISAASTPDLRGMGIAHRNATLYHTLRAVFPQVEAAGERMLVLVGGREQAAISMASDVLQNRYQTRAITGDAFSEARLAALLREPQRSRINWHVRRHGRSPTAHRERPPPPPLIPKSAEALARAEADWPPVAARRFINTDLKPVAVYYTLMFWDETTGGSTQALWRHLLHARPTWLAAPVILALAINLLLRGRARHPSHSALGLRFPVLTAVFTTGFSTMALQMALIFAFQSVYGFVYEMIALIVAVFMGGLALGAYTVQRHVVNKTSLRKLAAVQIVTALLAVLIALAVRQASALASPNVLLVVFFGLTFAAGLINGIDFPLATGCCIALDRHANRSTSAVYGMELLGACLGAILTGVLVVPLWGIIACGWLAAAANGAAGIMLWTWGNVTLDKRSPSKRNDNESTRFS